MSIFDRLLGRQEARREAQAFFRMLTAYEPHFRRWNRRLYEVDAVRSAVSTTARHASKLTIKIDGAAQPKLQTMLKKRPNQLNTWSQFFARVSTILDMQNTVIIIPLFNRSMEIVGLWPVLPSRCELVKDTTEKLWVRYEFSNKEKGACELERCGVMLQNQYENDFFGSGNEDLEETAEMAFIQRQGIQEAIKSSAAFRFMARVTNWKDPEDLAVEQKNFTTRNLSSDKGGFLLFPNNYDNIQQITSKPYAITKDDQDLIRVSVNSHFGTNDDVIQNKATAQQLDVFYEGKIEPFALQLGEVLTFMLFTDTEIGHGARVHITANRLQYMTAGEKINFIAQLGDRGFITIDEGRELLNYPPLPDGKGELVPIRGEFKYVGEEQPAEPAKEEENGDQE